MQEAFDTGPFSQKARTLVSSSGHPGEVRHIDRSDLATSSLALQGPIVLFGDLGQIARSTKSCGLKLDLLQEHSGC